MEDLLAKLKLQEEKLQFERFSNEDAIRLGLIIYEIAKKESLPVTIDITRSGQQLFHVSMPGTAPDNDEWVRRKVKLVTRIQHSSFYIGTELRMNNQTLEEAKELSHYEYAAHGGCFPVIIKGTGMVGTVTVSGLEQSEDHALVIRGIEEFMREGKNENSSNI